MSPLSEKIALRKPRWNDFLASQTNSAHKHIQWGSQISEPISAWKVYFRSPPGEIYKCSLQTTLVFPLKAETIFFCCSFCLSSSWCSKMGKARKGTTTSKQTKAAGQKKQVKENMVALSDPINLRERMIMALTCTYSKQLHLNRGARTPKRRNQPTCIHRARGI